MAHYPLGSMSAKRRAGQGLVLAVVGAVIMAACGSTTAAGPGTASPSTTPTQAAGIPPAASPGTATPSPALSPSPGLAKAPAASPGPINPPSPTASLPPAAGLRLAGAISPRNVPNPVPGATNGSMAAGLLIYVDRNCDAYRPAATSLERLFSIARAEGVSLASQRCYRPLEIQQADRSSACTSGNCACAAVGGTSMHGWGEAVDFADASGSVDTFTSPTYRWLVAEAARFGWNHPGWAVPGGGPCPEPWHWEWVGDGGGFHAVPVMADVVAGVPTADGKGYRIVTGLGSVSGHGSAGSGTANTGLNLNRVLVGGAPAGSGYWLVAADGGVFALGGAPFLGAVTSPGQVGSGPTIAGMAATPDGQGYWLVSTDGQVFNFGGAPALTGPTAGARYFVGIASTPSGKGAWVAASDGSVTALGDAQSLPTPGVDRGADPVVAICSAPSGQGFWLSTADGRVSAFGSAADHGSIPPGAPGITNPPEPVVSMAATPSGQGYWLTTADGNVYAFGDAPYLGGD